MVKKLPVKFTQNCSNFLTPYFSTVSTFTKFCTPETAILRGFNRLFINFTAFSAILHFLCFARQATISSHCYILESAVANEKWERYTFLGFDPKLEITCKGEDMKIGDVRLKSSSPAEHIRQLLSEYKSPKFDYLPSFTGGLVGYFSYDYLGYAESTVRNNSEDIENFNDVDLMLFDKVIAFDNLKQKIILIANMSLSDIETNYNKVVYELKKLAELIRFGEKKNEAGKLLEDVKPLFDKEHFCEMVERAKHHIYDGDIFQIVLSNRLSAPFEGSLLNTYRVLQTLNPSPYMFYLSGTDIEVAGASPETLVKLENGIMHTFPLVGTKPRGRTEDEDKALETELLADEKELVEHNMLVDLGRNDLGGLNYKLCKCIFQQKMLRLKKQSKRGNAEERPNADCEIIR